MALFDDLQQIFQGQVPEAQQPQLDGGFLERFHNLRQESAEREHKEAVRKREEEFMQNVNFLSGDEIDTSPQAQQDRMAVLQEIGPEGVSQFFDERRQEREDMPEGFMATLSGERARAKGKETPARSALSRTAGRAAAFTPYVGTYNQLERRLERGEITQEQFDQELRNIFDDAGLDPRATDSEALRQLGADTAVTASLALGGMSAPGTGIARVAGQVGTDSTLGALYFGGAEAADMDATGEDIAQQAAWGGGIGGAAGLVLAGIGKAIKIPRERAGRRATEAMKRAEDAQIEESIEAFIRETEIPRLPAPTGRGAGTGVMVDGADPAVLKRLNEIDTKVTEVARTGRISADEARKLMREKHQLEEQIRTGRRPAEATEPSPTAQMQTGNMDKVVDATPVPGSASEAVGRTEMRVPESTIERVTNALKEAPPILRQQDRARSQERQRRVAQAIKAGDKKSGEAAYKAQLASLKGDLPKAEFESLRNQISEADINAMFTQVQTSNRLTFFESINARKALAKIFDREAGGLPTRSEIALLEREFGGELTDALLEKMPLMHRAGQMGLDIANIPRTIMASVDISAPFRQGLFLVRYPREFVSAFGEMMRILPSKKRYQALQENIANRPTHQLHREMGIEFTDINTKILTGREEKFMSNIAGKIPGIGASGRAYTGFLNKLRADVADNLIEKAERAGRDVMNDAKLKKDLGKFINAASGRGSLGRLESMTPAINASFFSGKLIASRLQLLNPAFYARLDPMVRRQALESLFAATAFTSSVLSLAKMGGAEVELDPRSSDFAKIKVGDTRIDPLGGFQQYIRLGAQLASGSVVSTRTGDEYEVRDRAQLLGRFARSKLAPTAGFVYSWASGSDFMGRPFDASEEVKNMFVPFSIQDTRSIIREHGTEGIGLTVAPALGLGVVVHEGRAPSQLNHVLGSTDRDDPLYQTLNEVERATGYSPGEPGKTQRGKELNDEEYEKYTRKYRKHYKELLARAVKSNSFQNTTSENKADVLKAINLRAGNAARDEMFGEVDRTPSEASQILDIIF